MEPVYGVNMLDRQLPKRMQTSCSPKWLHESMQKSAQASMTMQKKQSPNAKTKANGGPGNGFEARPSVAGRVHRLT